MVGDGPRAQDKGALGLKPGERRVPADRGPASYEPSAQCVGAMRESVEDLWHQCAIRHGIVKKGN